jgi:hypothetical protein
MSHPTEASERGRRLQLCLADRLYPRLYREILRNDETGLFLRGLIEEVPSTFWWFVYRSLPGGENARDFRRRLRRDLISVRRTNPSPAYPKVHVVIAGTELSQADKSFGRTPTLRHHSSTGCSSLIWSAAGQFFETPAGPNSTSRARLRRLSLQRWQNSLRSRVKRRHRCKRAGPSHWTRRRRARVSAERSATIPTCAKKSAWPN